MKLLDDKGKEVLDKDGKIMVDNFRMWRFGLWIQTVQILPNYSYCRLCKLQNNRLYNHFLWLLKMFWKYLL
jgi:hypothetical protein